MAITKPREDNPARIFDEANMRIGLICTDCEPNQVVSENDVSHWKEMPGEMAEKEGIQLAAEGMAAWFEHMRVAHGIVPRIRIDP